MASENFSYTKTGQTVRIDKVEQPGTVVVIPERMEDCLVTELGAYVLAGSNVEELHLPVQLKKIGAYGFYNCEKLKRLYCGSRAADLGAGLFAGTGGVEFLDFTLFEGERSCLKELLSELRQTLRVRIHLSKEGNTGGERVTEARLIFPEYFEESVENTPARILYIETHGCGHRYRYCFAGTQFQYQEYDELFPHVKVQEPEELVAELAMGRLQYPLGLTGRHEKMYREYVAKHWKMAGKLLLETDGRSKGRCGNLDPGGIPWLVREILDQQQSQEEAALRPEASDNNPAEKITLEEKLRELTRMAQQAQDTETVAWLMDFRHQAGMQRRGLQETGARKKRRFEL